MINYFIYNTSSPSCLMWAHDASSEGRGSAERKPYTDAGSLSKNFWHVQVKENGIRHRSTAHRVVWMLHNGTIPPLHVIYHRNGDTTDNRIENLMMVNRQTFNYIKAWKHGTENVRQSTSGRWYATIRGYKSLGSYDTYEEAATVYRKELQQLLTTLGVLP